MHILNPKVDQVGSRKLCNLCLAQVLSRGCVCPPPPCKVTFLGRFLVQAVELWNYLLHCPPRNPQSFSVSNFVSLEGLGGGWGQGQCNKKLNNLTIYAKGQVKPRGARLGIQSPRNDSGGFPPSPPAKLHFRFGDFQCKLWNC
jgi:hypothetical protein